MATELLDTNLLTGKKGKTAGAAGASESLAAPPPISKTKKIVKLVSYVIIFFVSLILFLVLKLPDSLLTNVLLGRLNSTTPYHWQADKISVQFFLLPHLHAEKLEMEPKFLQATGNNLAISLDQINLYPSLLGLASGSLSGSFDAEAYKAKFSGAASMGRSTELTFSTENLDLSRFTPLLDAGYDLRGMLKNGNFSFSMPGQKIAQSDGDIKISGQNIQFDPSTLQLPVALPFLDLGPMDIQAKIQKGRLKIEKFVVGGAAKDMEIRIEGDIQLADIIQYSQLNLKIRFKPSEKVLKAIPSLSSMLSYLAALRPDGFYGTKISGQFQAIGMPTPDPN